MTNAPERSACFLLDEDIGEVKISYAPDTKVSNAGMFVLNKEDHTLGNLLRLQLLRNPDVRFSGYRIPHPLVHYIEVKIQTSSGNVTPTEVLSAAIEDLSNECDFLESAAIEAIDTWKTKHGTLGT